MPDYRERVHADPAILNGKPVIRGTRISVELILQRLSEGLTVADLIEAWPNLTTEDIQAALAYSAVNTASCWDEPSFK
jgi:uncharacterized protein (DUF433 family)